MLRLHPDGSLDVASVDALDPDALSDWILDRLHDRDTQVPDDPRQDVGQGYLVGAIYPDLAAGTRRDVRETLGQFLRQMETGDDAWRGDPGDRLLRLVMQIGDRELAAPARHMAVRGHATDGTPFDDDRLARLVQVLTYVGEPMPAEFWNDLADHDPERFAVPAFAGLRAHSVEQALGLLERLYLDDSVGRRLTMTVRGLLADSDPTPSDLRKTIEALSTGDYPGMLSVDTIAYLKRVLPEVWATPSYGRHLAALNSAPRLGTLCHA